MAVAMGFRVARLANEARAGAPHATHAACRGYRLCAGGYRTVSAAGGVMLSTIVDCGSWSPPTVSGNRVLVRVCSDPTEGG